MKWLIKLWRGLLWPLRKRRAINAISKVDALYVYPMVIWLSFGEGEKAWMKGGERELQKEFSEKLEDLHESFVLSLENTRKSRKKLLRKKFIPFSLTDMKLKKESQELMAERGMLGDLSTLEGDDFLVSGEAT